MIHSASSLYSRRLLLVVGKGGVGRTTVASALAVVAAAEGKRVLLAQTNSLQPIETLFGFPSSPSSITLVRKGLWAVSMTPNAALKEYGTMVLHSSFLSHQLFERETIQTLLKAVPGVFEYSMLGKVWYHTTEMVGAEHRFDLVILDAPATGHLLPMLQIPENILRLTSRGPLSGPAKACHSLLTDPERCLSVLVTLPEELPCAESIELYQKLLTRKISTGVVLTNRVIPRRFDDKEAAALASLHHRDFSSKVAPPIDAAWLEHQRAVSQQEHILSLSQRVKAPKLHLPELHAPSSHIELIEQLAEHLSTATLLA